MTSQTRLHVSLAGARPNCASLAFSQRPSCVPARFHQRRGVRKQVWRVLWSTGSCWPICNTAWVSVCMRRLGHASFYCCCRCSAVFLCSPQFTQYSFLSPRTSAHTAHLPWRARVRYCLLPAPPSQQQQQQLRRLRPGWEVSSNRKRAWLLFSWW